MYFIFTLDRSDIGELIAIFIKDSSYQLFYHCSVMGFSVKCPLFTAAVFGTECHLDFWKIMGQV